MTYTTSTTGTNSTCTISPGTTINPFFYTAIKKNDLFECDFDKFINNIFYKPTNVITTIGCLDFRVKPFNRISVDEIIKGKVYKFTFDNKIKIKTVYADDDINFFSFDYAVCLAIAKYMFKDLLTFEGILEEAYNLQKFKPIQKIIKQLTKEVKEKREEIRKKKEYDETKKRQHAKYIRKKIERKQRKRQEQIDIIKEAIK